MLCQLIISASIEMQIIETKMSVSYISVIINISFQINCESVNTSFLRFSCSGYVDSHLPWSGFSSLTIDFEIYRDVGNDVSFVLRIIKWLGILQKIRNIWWLMPSTADLRQGVFFPLWLFLVIFPPLFQLLLGHQFSLWFL